jgi:protoporphyrinogen oxidase
LELNRLSRRELLTTLLGGAVAATACRQRATTPRFDGQLLGQNVERGHRLRDGMNQPPVRRERVGVVIAGAGPSGLSAAWKLRKSGFTDFVVLELEDDIGGTSASGSNSVSPYPWGAHYVPAPAAENRALTELIGELGIIEGVDRQGDPIIAEDRLCRAPQERLFIGGRWEEGLYPRLGASAEDLRQLRAFNAEVDRWVAFRDDTSRRAFTLPSANGGAHPDLDALDRLSMAEFLRQRKLDSPRLRWFVEYACRDDYGCTLETTSAWAGLFYFASRVERPGEKAAEFIAFPEGNGRLVRHLAQSAEGRLRKGHAAIDIRPGEVRAFDFARNEVVAFDCDDVVVAMPRHVAARVVAPWRESPPAFLQQFTTSSWMVANLTLNSRPAEKTFPLAWDNVLYDSRSLGYVDATHQVGKDYGSTVWTYYLPLLDGTPKEQRQILLDSTWRHWVDVILSDLGRAHPDLPERIRTIDVWRWGHAMVRPTVGLLRGGALAQARQPIGRIHFAHTDLSGMALFEEAQHWGLVAAEAILTQRGLPFRSSL